MLEILGYEYSDKGLSRYRDERPNIMPSLIAAISNDLREHRLFPAFFRDHLPETGMYIEQRGQDFVFADIDKPSVWGRAGFVTAEGAARALIRRRCDAYWLKPDSGNDEAPTYVRYSWLPDIYPGWIEIRKEGNH